MINVDDYEAFEAEGNDLEDYSIQETHCAKFVDEILAEKNRRLALHNEIKSLVDKLFPNKWKN